MDEELQLVTTVRPKKSNPPPPIHIPRPDTLDLNRDVQFLPPRPVVLQHQKSFTHNVTNSVQRTLDLGFTDLSYSVKMGIKRESKAILRGVSGLFPAGQLSAIMGASGAGKSSLMNVLAGYTTTGVSVSVNGEITVNGTSRDIDAFRRHSCYIMQQDCLQPLLTVGEAMHVAAELKLGSELSREQKKAWVKEILEALGLSSARKTITCQLSGGQRKRLAIALELVNNPPVMFFDEPTSGLDSSASKQCMTLLKSLARGGRTIVITIHQPSAMLFDELDQLFVLAEGRCVYRGEPKQLLPFLTHAASLVCPPYHNPADYILEVSMGDYGQFNDRLVDSIQNGKCNDWIRGSSAPTPATIFKSPHLVNGLQTPVRAPMLPSGAIAKTLTTLSNGGLAVQDSKSICTRSYPASSWKQFYVLLRRSFCILRRDRFLMQMRLSMHLLVGLLIGTLYFKIGDSASNVLDNFGLLFYTVVFLMFTSLISMIVTFPLQLPIIAREHFNRWYSLKWYYLAVTLADIPIQTACSLGYGVLVYLLSAQPSDLGRFCMYCTMCMLVSMVAQSMGLLVGSCTNIQNGVFFGPLTCMPAIMFAGFFIHMKDSPSMLHWLFHISYMKYGLEGMMVAVYGYGREKLKCDADYCHFNRPIKFLEDIGMDHGDFWFDTWLLLALLVFLRVTTFIALNWRLRHIRN